MNLYKRNLLTLLDFTPEEIQYLLDLSIKLKKMKHNGEDHSVLKGKNIVLLFEKDSTRTRCAFEVAAADLGMNAVYIGSSGSQMGKKESIADTARVLGRMFDGIEYRGFKQKTVEDLAKFSNVPTWNGLTESASPIETQTSVAITSQSLTPSSTFSVNVNLAPVTLAISKHLFLNASFGHNSFGPTIR